MLPLTTCVGFLLACVGLFPTYVGLFPARIGCLSVCVEALSWVSAPLARLPKKKKNSCLDFKVVLSYSFSWYIGGMVNNHNLQ